MFSHNWDSCSYHCVVFVCNLVWLGLVVSRGFCVAFGIRLDLRFKPQFWFQHCSAVCCAIGYQNVRIHSNQQSETFKAKRRHCRCEHPAQIDIWSNTLELIALFCSLLCNRVPSCTYPQQSNKARYLMRGNGIVVVSIRHKSMFKVIP